MTSLHTTVDIPTTMMRFRGPDGVKFQSKCTQKSLSIATWTKLCIFNTKLHHDGIPDAQSSSRKLHTNR
ncbi:hypothetical protein JTE90_002993 [Oedothorax gibbosus]|uniref:Uncharacterized protein n=1 Tax=Oedothorax gibbosus TaxID=931172 RepID=A0AAV6VGC0_9ARAC|nr:hypothetical protein JTE90_002993 [Oedothorax gibbosus]